MPTYQVAWNELTKEVLIQNQGETVPEGCINAGSFIDENGPFEPNISDVLYHSVRDVLYKRRYLSMQGVKILSVLPTPVALAIQGVTSANGAVGSAFSVQLTRVGGTGPFSWSLPTKPTGAIINASGKIDWASPTLGNTTIVAQIQDSTGATDTHSIAVTIAAQPAELEVDGAPTVAKQQGQASTEQYARTGGIAPYTWSLLNAPNGVTINQSGLVTFGANIPNNTYNFVVRVVDGNSTAVDQPVVLTVATTAGDPNARPILFYGPANAFESGTQGYLDSGTFVGTPNSKVAEFTAQTGDNDYAWFAPLAAGADSIVFTEKLSTFAGGWAGGGLPGPVIEATPSPDTVGVLFTDKFGFQRKLYRHNMIGGMPDPFVWVTS